MASHSEFAKHRNKLCAILLSFLLAFTMLPLLPSQQALAEEYSLSQAESAKIMLQEGHDYVPGEAIVIMDDSAPQNTMRALSNDLLSTAEPLMTVSKTALEELTPENAGQSRVLSTMSTQADLAIKHITSTELSTDQLLEALAADTRVLIVQPNYLYERDSDWSFDSDATTQYKPTALLPQNETADLTKYQWANENTKETIFLLGKKELGFDTKSPKWAVNRTTPGIENATGTIAVLDSGIDYNHDDLKNVVRSDMNTFVGYGGAHGFCAVDGADATDPMDIDGHGTHCAGIIAGEWNSFGTSGIASGQNMKLVAVRIENEQGLITDAWAIKGYEYLAEAMRNNLDLKAINNSWGGPSVSPAFCAAVNTLGELGAISVVASGNETKDIDINPDTSSGVHQSPYSVVVNSSTMAASASPFSNYGRYTTNIFAPGSMILSTYPLAKAAYMPEAVAQTSGKNIVYENFINDGTSPRVRFWKTYENIGTESIGGYDADAYFEHSPSNPTQEMSWKVEEKDLEEGTVEFGNTTMCSQYSRVFVEISKDKEGEVDQVAFHFNTEGWTGTSGARLIVKCVKNSSPNEDIGAVAASEALSGNDWGTVSLDLESFCIKNEATPLIHNDGHTLWLEGRIDFFVEEGSTENHPASYHVDAFGVGASDSAVPYAYSSGTSMAAPAATGAAAVLALNDDTSKLASEQAKLRAARLKGSVKPIDAFDGKCTSGGELDLSYHEAGDYTPVIDSVQTNLNSQNEYELTISGYFFGDNPGTLALSDSSVTIQSWTDTQIIALCPSTMQDGLHEVAVTSLAQNRTGRGGFLLAFPEYPNESKTPRFEIDYPLPTEDQGFSSSTASVKMTGLAGNLYLMPYSTDEEALSETLFKLNVNAKSWEAIAGFPSPLLGASMTTYDGKIFVTGRLATTPHTQGVWSYDPAINSWSELNGSNIPYYAGIVNCNETLYVAGGKLFSEEKQEYEHNTNLLTYNPADGVTQKVAELPAAGNSPFVQAHGDKVLVSGGGHLHKSGSLLMYSSSTGTLSELSKFFPGFNDARSNDYGIAAVEAGAVISGVIASSDWATFDDEDTYLLELDSPNQSEALATLAQGSVFKGLGKRVSNAPLYTPSSAAYKGMLYTFGVSVYEPTEYILRATEMNTLAQPGDLYTITYNNVDPREHSNSATYSPTSLPSSLKAAADRSDMRFVGWYDNAQFNGTAVTQIARGSSGDLVYWTKWEPIDGPTPSPSPNPEQGSNHSALTKAGDFTHIAILAITLLMILSVITLRAIRRRT